MFEQGTSDKFKFVALGELPPPGSCVGCGSGTREEGYVDLGFYMEYVGEALICYTCVIQMGEVIKMLHPDEAKILHEINRGLMEELEENKQELLTANERLAAYDLTFRHFVDSHPNSLDDISDPDQPALVEVPSRPTPRKRAPTKSSTGAGPINAGTFGPSDGQSQADESRENPLTI